MTNRPLLVVHELRVGYGTTTVLNGSSVDVLDGQAVVVLGANGAGKTTLLRAISGLLPLTGGSIRFGDRQLHVLPPHKISALGVAHVAEGRALFPGLTVSENLTIGALARSARERRESLEEVTTLFPWIGERLKQKAGTLSGGEQQMVAIARGLMSRPTLLMLDEPSLGLSPKLVDEVFETLRRIHRQGVPLLLVEQNVQHALALADYAYVMSGGRIVLEGDPETMARSSQLRTAYLGAES